MMKNKILVTDSISLEVSEKQIEVSTLLPFEIQVYFTESASLSWMQMVRSWVRTITSTFLPNQKTCRNTVCKVTYLTQSRITGS